MGPALWNIQAKAITGHISKMEMSFLVTVNVAAFNWEHDGYSSQGQVYDIFIYFDIPATFP